MKTLIGMLALFSSTFAQAGEVFALHAQLAVTQCIPVQGMQICTAVAAEPAAIEIPIDECTESGICFGDLVGTSEVRGTKVETKFSVRKSIGVTITAAVRLSGQAWRSVQVKVNGRNGLTDSVGFEGETKVLGPQSSLTPAIEIEN